MGIYPESSVAFKWAQRFGTFSPVGGPFAEAVSGNLRLLNFGAVEFNIDAPNWFPNLSDKPCSHPTWRLYFYSLTWVADFLREANGNTDSADAGAMQEYSRSLTESWWKANSSAVFPKEAWDSHGVAMRSAFLILLYQVFPEDWLHDAIRAHGEHLVREFSGHWNHGLIESISLYAMGIELRIDEFRRLGRKRIMECVHVMIDDEGATNEQAPTYSGYIWRLMSRAIICSTSYEDESLSEILTTKSLLLENFMLHSLQPNRRFVEIGDSYPSLPGNHPGSVVNWFARPARGGSPAKELKTCFSRGYIFGRTSWEMEDPIENNSYFSFRFGPGREVHGHNDHLGLTFWSYGRGIITDSGHVGYEKNKWRSFVQSPPAHNTIVIDGRRFDHSKPTELLFSDLKDSRGVSHFKAKDYAFENAVRAREVIVVDSGPLVVLDEVENTFSGKIDASQLWHFAPEFRIVSDEHEEVLLESIDGRILTSLFSFEIDQSNGVDVLDTDAWRGSESPVQGWASSGSRTLAARTTVAVKTRASRSRILTALIPRPAEIELSCQLVESNPQDSILEIQLGGKLYTFAIKIQKTESSAQIEYR